MSDVTAQVKILLTGATGFIGGAVLVELAQRGLLCNTVLLVRASDQEQALARVQANLSVFECQITASDLTAQQMICADLSDTASLQTANWQGITHVIHCAALATFSNNPKIWALNVDGTLALAKAIQAGGTLQRWIQVGTAMSCGPGLTSPVSESWELGADQDAHLVPYTRSKIAAEHALRELPNFPLVVARPSIVVGHSTLGCKPSPSIFWVFRMAFALERFTCGAFEQIDIVPVDWCARALLSLCLKPKLAHDLYHVSAGSAGSNQFIEIDAAYAKATGAEPIAPRYAQVALADLKSLVPLFEEKLGKVNRILILRALMLYGAFAELNYVFANQRLLDEGIEAAPSFASFVHQCVHTSEAIPMLDQMAHDFK